MLFKTMKKENIRTYRFKYQIIKYQNFCKERHLLCNDYLVIKEIDNYLTQKN